MKRPHFCFPRSLHQTLSSLGCEQRLPEALSMTHDTSLCGGHIRTKSIPFLRTCLQARVKFNAEKAVWAELINSFELKPTRRFKICSMYYSQKHNSAILPEKSFTILINRCPILSIYPCCKHRTWSSTHRCSFERLTRSCLCASQKIVSCFRTSACRTTVRDRS